MTEPSAKQLGFLTKVVRKEGEDKCDQKKAMQQLFVDKNMDRFCLKKKKVFNFQYYIEEYKE